MSTHAVQSTRDTYLFLRTAMGGNPQTRCRWLKTSTPPRDPGPLARQDHRGGVAPWSTLLERLLGLCGRELGRPRAGRCCSCGSGSGWRRAGGGGRGRGGDRSCGSRCRRLRLRRAGGGCGGARSAGSRVGRLLRLPRLLGGCSGRRCGGSGCRRLCRSSGCLCLGGPRTGGSWSLGLSCLALLPRPLWRRGLSEHTAGAVGRGRRGGGTRGSGSGCRASRGGRSVRIEVEPRETCGHVEVEERHRGTDGWLRGKGRARASREDDWLGVAEGV